jgi:transcriptional regulator with XRE-family HTH domain
MQLAAGLGLNRSAVAQWERKGGSRPTSENLAKIAVATKVNFDWLATGRGKSSLPAEGHGETPALELTYFARNDAEERILLGFRRMSERKQEALLDLLDSSNA